MSVKHISGISGKTETTELAHSHIVSLLRSFFVGSLCFLCTTLKIEIH